MYASLKSPWDVQFGLHLCFTRVLPASLFDKLASNRIAAQLSANLMAPGQPQDLADHHDKPSHCTLKFSSSSSSFLPIFLPLLSSCTALPSCKQPTLTPAFTFTSAGSFPADLLYYLRLSFSATRPHDLFVSVASHHRGDLTRTSLPHPFISPLSIRSVIAGGSIVVPLCWTADTLHALTNTCTHTRTHARAHAHTH